MKATVWTSYGPPDVLQLRELEKPVPKDHEVLIKIRAATVTAGDCEAREMKFASWIGLAMRLYIGLLRPTRVKVLGQELAGEIEAIGRDVTRFKEGDQVFAATFFRFGAYAEYVCLPAKYARFKPASMSAEEAATIPTGGVNGLHFLTVADVQAGERVLINGAGGSIGTYAIQIAKAWGAEVTAVDSTGKLAMLRSIGADDVVDYTQEDFTRNGKTYDVIIDVVGKSPFSRTIRSINRGGRYVLGNPSLSAIIRGKWSSRSAEKQVIAKTATYQNEDYARLITLIEAGAIKPVIDRRYPLEQTAEAHRYVETGQKKGNVVITVG